MPFKIQWENPGRTSPSPYRADLMLDSWRKTPDRPLRDWKSVDLFGYRANGQSWGVSWTSSKHLNELLVPAVFGDDATVDLIWDIKENERTPVYKIGEFATLLEEYVGKLGPPKAGIATVETADHSFEIYGGMKSHSTIVASSSLAPERAIGSILLLIEPIGHVEALNPHFADGVNAVRRSFRKLATVQRRTGSFDQAVAAANDSIGIGV